MFTLGRKHFRFKTGSEYLTILVLLKFWGLVKICSYRNVCTLFQMAVGSKDYKIPQSGDIDDKFKCIYFFLF